MTTPICASKTKRNNSQYNTYTHVKLKGRTAIITLIKLKGRTVNITPIKLKGRTANITPIHMYN